MISLSPYPRAFKSTVTRNFFFLSILTWRMSFESNSKSIHLPSWGTILAENEDSYTAVLVFTSKNTPGNGGAATITLSGTVHYKRAVRVMRGISPK
jgi:hypothetical protein